MKLPTWIVDALVRRILRPTVLTRAPDFVIGGEEDPYLRRWWVIRRNQWFNVYLHQFLRDDDDRALHDHPWINCSILLVGSYVEHTIAAGGINHREVRTAGDLVFRGPRDAHRIELVDRTATCWTLFLTGPVVRQWGFHCPQGWRHWRDFTSGPRGETVGKGCDP
jgi:hypothetical protein